MMEVIWHTTPLSCSSPTNVVDVFLALVGSSGLLLIISHPCFREVNEQYMTMSCNKSFTLTRLSMLFMSCMTIVEGHPSLSSPTSILAIAPFSITGPSHIHVPCGSCHNKLLVYRLQHCGLTSSCLTHPLHQSGCCR